MSIDTEMEIRLVIYTPSGRILLEQRYLKSTDSTIYMLPRTRMGSSLTSADAALAFFDDHPLKPRALCALCVLRPDISEQMEFFSSYGVALAEELDSKLAKEPYVQLELHELDGLVEGGEITASDYALLVFAERVDIPGRLADLG